MRRIVMLAVVLAGLLAVPIGGGARPASFKSWSVRWSARTARDNARVVDHCAKLFGGSDLKFGMCYVKAGRANLRAERSAWEKQVASVIGGQPIACQRAITAYVAAARARQAANLVYLDSHRRTPLTRIAGEISGEPYAALKSASDAARAHAVAVCG
jgi:hypothetical protein